MVMKSLNKYKQESIIEEIAFDDVDGLTQDCSNSIANAMELLQSCVKPSMSSGIWQISCLDLKIFMMHQHKPWLEPVIIRFTDEYITIYHQAQVIDFTLQSKSIQDWLTVIEWGMSPGGHYQNY